MTFDHPDRKDLIPYLRSRLESALGASEGFSVGFPKHPRRSFDWCDATMEKVASIEPLERVIGYLDNDEIPMERIVDDVLRRALTFASCVQKSTAAPSNLMHRYEGAAWASIAEVLLGYSLV